MKKIFCIILLMWPLSAISIAQNAYLSNIYIEANGNNKYEAKIKANELGMRRSVALLADRMGVHDVDFSKVPYNDLAEALEVNDARDEQFEGGWYSAVVNYGYNQRKLNAIIFRFGGDKVSDMVYECLLIPVFKRQKTITLWDSKVQWLNTWDQLFPHIEQHKLYYPEDMISGRLNITKENVFSLTYDDFLSFFPKQIFKTVLVAVAEYYTEDNGNSYLQITYTIFDTAKVSSETKKYNMLDKKDADRVVREAVDDILVKYGIQDKKGIVASTLAGDKELRFAPKDIDIKEYMMFVESYDDKTLQRIKTQLNKVTQVISFGITPDSSNRYKVILRSKEDLEGVAHGLYANDLSYMKIGDEYHLIEKMSGV